MFDFLPEGIDPTLKIVIYVLIFVHLLAFTVWILLFAKSVKQPPNSFE
jgi:hypothetical protein